MTSILFLTQRMKMGYGVDLAVHEVSQQLAAGGFGVTVLCNDADTTYRGRYEMVERTSIPGLIFVIRNRRRVWEKRRLIAARRKASAAAMLRWFSIEPVAFDAT